MSGSVEQREPPQGLVPRVLVVVCDSWGVGGAPDATDYGDEGSDTLGNTSRVVGGIHAPALESLGLGLLTSIEGVAPRADAGTAHGWAIERSAGKDTTTGHWEMMGIRLDEPFPLYPDGFPPEVVVPFERAIGHRILGNEPASGTEIIARLGVEHLATGDPIVYTSGDSVFQIACHKAVVPLQRLYEWCRIARELLVPPHRVGRVIARPFEGEPGAFVRSPERRDLSVPPPGATVLDALQAAAVPVYGVGKIQDIFDRQGITEARYSDSNDHGVDLTVEYLAAPRTGVRVREPGRLRFQVRPSQRPRGIRGGGRSVRPPAPGADRVARRGRVVDHWGSRVRSHHPPDRPFPGTDPVAGCGSVRWTVRDRRLATGFGDLGRTVTTLLGVQVEGLVGSSFTDRLGFDGDTEAPSSGG